MKKWLFLCAVSALVGFVPVVAEAQQSAPPTAAPQVITVPENGTTLARGGLFRGRRAVRSSATVAPPLGTTAPGETIVPVNGTGSTRVGLLSRVRARR